MVNSIKKVSTVISYVVNYLFHPLLMPLYLFAILLFYSSMMMQNGMPVKFSILKMVTFITVLTPLISIGASALITRLLGERNSDFYNNLLISTILVVSYALAIYVLKDYITLRMSLRLLLAPLIIILQFHLFRLVGVRFSVWTAAVGALAALLYLFSFHYVGGLVQVLFSSIMVCGLVGSARLNLRKDSLESVSLGYLMGVAATLFSFYLPLL
ncbi:MAG: hypothetical protein RR550_02320 [Rikenellaceae bacterium]